jgi:hypothetical protein
VVEVEAELLVKKGLLPENLPPVFTSDELWAALWPKSTTYQVTAKAVGEGAHYNASNADSAEFFIFLTLFTSKNRAFSTRPIGPIFKSFSIMQALFPSLVLKRTRYDTYALRLILNCLKSV